ncbi:MAG: hypothetical protein KUG76_05130 [Gammaproteobacteria bacterium]|nr:hypothetical protein [Gammaproteobacteria bacterium]
MRNLVIAAFGLCLSGMVFGISRDVDTDTIGTNTLKLNAPLGSVAFELALLGDSGRDHSPMNSIVSFSPSGRIPLEIKRQRGAVNSSIDHGAFLWRRVSFDSSFGLSQRNANLSWSIASDMSGERAPNVLSELSYRGLQIRGIEIQSYFHFFGGLLDRSFVDLSVNRGVISDGETRDSDYSGNNKTKEYSRSLSRNTGDYVADYSLAYGYSWVSDEALSADVLVGYSLHHQFVRKQDAVRVEPESGVTSGSPIKGLNSTYQSEWQGPWLGAVLSWKGEQHKFKLQGEIHSAFYYAEANWNLRDGFMHPKSFEHNATGLGWVFDLSYAYVLSFAKASKSVVGVSYRAESWLAKDGVDTLYLANGEAVSTRLNEVIWGGSTMSVYFKVHR